MSRYYDIVYIILNIFALIIFQIFVLASLIVIVYCFIDVRRNNGTKVKGAKIMKIEIIKIKYFTDRIEKLDYVGGSKSNWIDLRASEDVELKKGEFKLIPLGVGMELPKGYEAHIVPRSSTFKNFGIIQTNHQGIIDNSYCGDNDQWYMPAYAVRDTEIHVNDRICQFRIMENQPKIIFDKVEYLNSKDRGGHGSTGKQ